MHSKHLPQPSVRFVHVWRRNQLVWTKLAIPSMIGNLADPMLYMLGLGYGRHLYLYAAGSAAGIVACISLAQALSRVRVLKWLGENSLTLFMFQGNVLILINVVIGQLNNAQITDWHV